VSLTILGFVEKIRANFGFKRRSKIFIGWWTALAIGIIWFFCYGIWSYSFGSYFKPLANEFHWNRAEMSGAFSLRTLGGGIIGPFVGYFTDKYGPKIVSLIGLITAGLGFFLLFFMNALWHWWLIWGLVISLGFNIALQNPLTKGLTEWFVKKRGLASGISKFFMGLGGLVMPIVMTYLVIQFGWRMAFVISGCVILTVSIPLVWFFIKPRRPEYYGQMPDGATVEGNPKDLALMIEAGQKYAAEAYDEVEFTIREASRTRVLWVLIIRTMLVQFCSSAVMVHLIPHMTDMGINPIDAATAIGILYGLGAPIRLLSGFVIDHCSTHRLKYMWMAAYGLEALGFIVLLNATTLPTIYLFVLLYGAGFGLMHPIQSTWIGRLFGRKAYGSITGTMIAIALPVTVVGPIYVGWIYDVTGSYAQVYLQNIVFIIIAIAVVGLFLTPPKHKPPTVTDIGKLV
jgi:MFS family permease